MNETKKTPPKFRVRPEWPHVLAIDSGWTHPTAATLVACSPEGFYIATRFYSEPGLYTDDHAASFLKMCSHVIGRRNFFAVMTDKRDPIFLQGIIKYTGGRISPGHVQVPNGWSIKYFKNAMIRKLYRIKADGKFIANEKDPYFQAARAEWGKYVWGKDEVPVKEEDDIQDTLLNAIWVSYPPRIDEVSKMATETREPSIKALVAKNKARKRQGESYVGTLG